MELLFSLLPIITVFLLLFKFKQSSMRSGIGSYFITIGITIFTSSFHLLPGEIIHASVKGSLISFIAAYVLIFGIFLFHLMNKAGAITQIATIITNFTNNHLMQVIIIVIGISPLIESSSGFGIAFMVVTPILIALGFTPFKSALIGLVSLIAVPWGALATGTVIGSNLSGVPLQKMSTGSAIISIPIFIYLVSVAIFIAGGWNGIKEKWKEIILFSSFFAISIIICSVFISVELSGVISSLLTLGLGIVYISGSTKFKQTATIAETNEFEMINIFKIISPYIFLTILIFITRVNEYIRNILESNVVLRLPSFSFSLPLLYSPGFWLLITSCFTILIYKINSKLIMESLKATFTQWVPFSITTTAFVAMSELMTESGMTSHISQVASTTFGTSFIVISSIIGGIGGYLTGSNTGSNAMFIKLQVDTANHLSLNPELFANIQNTSASHSTMASPSRVMLGATLCNIKDKENTLLGSISIIFLGSLLLIISTVTIWIMLS